MHFADFSVAAPPLSIIYKVNLPHYYVPDVDAGCMDGLLYGLRGLARLMEG
jgi:hypothetical protein